MKIHAFVNDINAVNEWLTSEVILAEPEAYYFSHWRHDDGIGFGLVITADRSGEFHLLTNGEVSYHIEQYNPQTGAFDVLHNFSSQAFELEDFIKIYSTFKNLVIS